MATLVITRWRENAIGFTAWDDRTESELSKRIKRAINASPDALRQIARGVHARKLLTIERVKEKEVTSVRQILETMGADVLALPGDIE